MRLDKEGHVYVFDQEWADHQSAIRTVYGLRRRVADGSLVIGGEQCH